GEKGAVEVRNIVRSRDDGPRRWRQRWAESGDVEGRGLPENHVAVRKRSPHAGLDRVVAVLEMERAKNVALQLGPDALPGDRLDDETREDVVRIRVRRNLRLAGRE